MSGKSKCFANGVFGELTIEAIEAFERRVHHPTQIGFCCFDRFGAGVVFFHHQHALDGDAVLHREVKIPFVVSRHSHHSAGSVGRNDEISEPNGDVFTRQWMGGKSSRKHALLFVHVLDAVKL